MLLQNQMKRFCLLAIVFILQTPANAQLYGGYQYSVLKYRMKGLNYDFFRFNNTGDGHTSYMRPGGLHGLSFGFYPDAGDWFSFGLGLRLRSYTTTGSRDIAPPGRPNEWSIKVINNAMVVSIGFNLKKFTVGYEIEIGRVKVMERKDDDGWRKMTGHPILENSLGLYALYRPEIRDPLFGFVKAYWRPSFSMSQLYGNDYMERDRFLHFGQVGVVLGLFYRDENW